MMEEKDRTDLADLTDRADLILAEPLFADPYDQVALVTEALTWRGCPFHLNGKAREGVGCIGLAQAIIGQWHPGIAALKLPRGTGRHGDVKALRRMGAYLFHYPNLFVRIDPIEPMPGDIVTFLVRDVGEFHFGLYLGWVDGTPRCVIHARPTYGVSLSSLLDTTYGGHLNECWRPLKA